MTATQTACAICGAAFPSSARTAAACPTCGATTGSGGAADLFAPAPPKKELPPPPTPQERAMAIAKASGFWGLIGLLGGAIPFSIVAAMISATTLDTMSRIQVGGGFGATLGTILGILWGAVHIEEISTPKAIGLGIIIGVPLSALYRFFLFPSDLMPESGVSDSIVMGVFSGVICGAIVSWLDRE